MLIPELLTEHLNKTMHAKPIEKIRKILRKRKHYKIFKLFRNQSQVMDHDEENQSSVAYARNMTGGIILPS